MCCEEVDISKSKTYSTADKAHRKLGIHNLTRSLASIGLTRRRGCFVDYWLDAAERWTDKEGTEDDGEKTTRKKTKMSSWT